MGLDMYLRKSTYVKNWDHQKPEEKHEIVVSKNGEPIEHIKQERIAYVIEEIGYWRKFNALHNWFVENVQDGRDECQESYVRKEDLEKLLKLLKQVKRNPSKASKLLPTTSGFFFGSTDYDEYYFEEVERTIKLLEDVLNDEKKFNIYSEFYYRSSW